MSITICSSRNMEFTDDLEEQVQDSPITDDFDDFEG
jgi:hypothetical protein